MAEAIYNPKTGDLVTEFDQLGVSKMKRGFAEIADANIDNIAEQNQTAPRNVRTGQTRGDQQIRGLYKVEDPSGRIVVMLGYTTGAF